MNVDRYIWANQDKRETLEERRVGIREKEDVNKEICDTKEERGKNTLGVDKEKFFVKCVSAKLW